MSKGAARGYTLAFFLLSLLSVRGAAQSSGGTAGGGIFPAISRLHSGDTGFRQFSADVENNRRRLSIRGRSGEKPRDFAESLVIYRYSPQVGEDLFLLASRCNIPYEALASLNRIRHPALLETGKPLLLPSVPGLFIPAEPLSDLEKLLGAARLASAATEAAELNIRTGGAASGGAFFFFPGAEFSPTEIAFFLNAAFRFPLRNYRLTSPFGPRQNPVTGNPRLHQGLDLAAPEGSEVFAAADGEVTKTGEDPVYGNYIIIKHGETWASLYGHLQKVETGLPAKVKSGSLIGRVGSTGQSTGPHLHFELRENGRARDPGKLLFQNKFE